MDNKGVWECANLQLGRQWKQHANKNIGKPTLILPIYTASCHSKL